MTELERLTEQRRALNAMLADCPAERVAANFAVRDNLDKRIKRLIGDEEA
jgi:hypothetical protein